MRRTRGRHPAVRRILDRTGLPNLVELLGLELSAPDLTSVLLAASEARADGLHPADVLRRYRTDRFSRPSEVSFLDLRRAEEAMIRATPGNWTWLTLSPVAPLGTHSAVAGVSQNRVITTARSGDVAADPTNALALEAAERRSSGESAVRLASIQRIVRAQRFEGEAAFPHFAIFALVTAGRSRAGHVFERDAIVEHLEILVAGLRGSGADRVEISLTDLTGRDQIGVLEALTVRFAGDGSVELREDPRRTAGRDYYDGTCFKVAATFESRTLEVADGGLVDWTQRMLSNRHERMCISGAGLDRIALMLGAS
jgi:hypothetical protein